MKKVCSVSLKRAGQGRSGEGGGVRTRPDVVIINDLIHLNKRIERREGEKKTSERKKEKVPIFCTQHIQSECVRVASAYTLREEELNEPG